MPLDPALPAGFYQTPNQERSEHDLAQWWENPYACTKPDGTLEVLCLDGGAWDRPTFYGQAANMQEADLLAQRKLASWRWVMQQPVRQIIENTIAMVLIPRLPHQEPVVLVKFALEDRAGAQAWLEQWQKDHAMPVFNSMDE